jgi:hypothetical protein
MRHSDGTWGGYSYEWDDAGTDATLLPANKSRQVGNQTWYYPTRISNQLATFEHLGLFETPLPAQESRARYAVPSGNDGLEQRVRAYLHANCSSCHRPNGTGRGPQDFRLATPLAQAGLCNAMPLEGDLGIANARLMAPGEPARSILLARMHALGAPRMPPLASRVEDTLGTALVDAWIASLTACP